jgi:hypothetical protein
MLLARRYLGIAKDKKENIVEEKNKDIVSIDFYDNQLTVIEKEGDAECCALEVEKKPFLYISGEVAEILISWLKSHEDDIAHEINDFGELKPVFESLFMVHENL